MPLGIEALRQETGVATRFARSTFSRGSSSCHSGGTLGMPQVDIFHFSTRESGSTNNNRFKGKGKGNERDK